jgi:PTK7 protein tyrosine kinase 7
LINVFLCITGHGEFGEVFLAKAKRDNEDTVVLVKALQQTRDEVALMEFKREIDMFHKLDHENVVKLMGVCRDQEPHYLILQYTDWVG